MDAIDAKGLTRSGVILIIALFLGFLATILLRYLMLPVSTDLGIESSTINLIGYLTTFVTRLFSVLAFVLMAVAGFSLAAKLKQVQANRTWAILIGWGALFGVVSRLFAAINNGIIAPLLSDMYIPRPLISLLQNSFETLFNLATLSVAVLFLIAAINVKKTVPKTTAMGVTAAILLAITIIAPRLFFSSLYSLANSLTIESGMSYQMFDFAMFLVQLLFFFPLIFFAIFLTIFFARITKQLRSGNYQIAAICPPPPAQAPFPPAQAPLPPQLAPYPPPPAQELCPPPPAQAPCPPPHAQAPYPHPSAQAPYPPSQAPFPPPQAPYLLPNGSPLTPL